MKLFLTVGNSVVNVIKAYPAERETIEGVKHSHRGSKMRTPHLMPLSRQAIEILKQIYYSSSNHELIFIGDHNPRKPMSKNTVNNVLRVMCYDTKTEVYGYGFRTMAHGTMGGSGLWADDVIERPLSHLEKNNVKVAYLHTSHHLDERQLMLQWWADYLDANRQRFISPYDYAQSTGWG